MDEEHELTPIGKALRKLRIDRAWLLKDMADGVGVSPSFLSAIETGRKPMPDDFVGRIVKWAKLDRESRKALEDASAISKKEFKIGVAPDMSESDLETAALLARFDELPKEDRERIHRILVRGMSSRLYADVRDNRQVYNALASWDRTLRTTAGAQTAWRTIGFQGGNEKREVIWLPQYHVWAYVGDWRDRPWTAYGCVSNSLPESLSITLEINPRVSHFNGRGRILIRDDQPDRMFLAHSGGKGGNRNIKKGVFFERITDIERDDERWFILGDVAEHTTVVNLVNYVQQVHHLVQELYG